MIEKTDSNKIIHGIPVSDGIAIGKAFILKSSWDEVNEIPLKKSFIEEEIKRYNNALKDVTRQLVEYKDRVLKEIGEDEAKIFDAQLAILNDPFFQGEIPAAIKNTHKNSEFLLKKGFERLKESFNKMENEYFKQRIIDIEDVSVRILLILLRTEMQKIPHKKNTILVSHTITPSDTARVDNEQVKAFVTELGGSTSHASIIARSIGIPAVVGIDKIIERVKDGDKLIVDGNAGTIYINPPKQILRIYQQRKRKYDIYLKRINKDIEFESVTTDGVNISLQANVAMTADAKLAIRNNADGIGLFRTELPFMVAGRLLNEDEQFSIYKNIVEIMSGKTVTIRTLDLGGDKFLPFQNVQQERNPFLGWRSIRIFLQEKDIFKTQLRAILRASNFGKVQILYPMISSYEEIIQIDDLLEETKKELKSKSIPFDENIKTGIMVEVPSLAIMINEVIDSTDFVSIGTNDLIQYTLAVDRNNEKVAKFYNPNNPAVLRLINNTIKAANAANKPVSICGEIAANPFYTALFIGFGLRNFSMTPLLLPELKERVRALSLKECKEISSIILNTLSSKKIIKILWDFHIQANKNQDVPSIIKQIS